jgi:sigma-E factor negative regulatory protein RseC
MLTETGRVVAVESDSLWVETIRQSTCGSCQASKGCGHGLLNRIRQQRHGLIRVLPGREYPANCSIDDEVRIGIPEGVVLQGSLLVYLLPLLGMLAGAAGAEWLAGSEPATVLGAVLGFAAGAAAVRLHAWRHRQDASLHPVLIEIVRPAAHPLRVG